MCTITTMLFRASLPLSIATKISVNTLIVLMIRMRICVLNCWNLKSFFLSFLLVFRLKTSTDWWTRYEVYKWCGIKALNELFIFFSVKFSNIWKFSRINTEHSFMMDFILVVILPNLHVFLLFSSFCLIHYYQTLTKSILKKVKIQSIFHLDSFLHFFRKSWSTMPHWFYGLSLNNCNISSFDEWKFIQNLMK